MRQDRGPFVTAYQALMVSPEYKRLSRDAAAAFWALKAGPDNNQLGFFHTYNEAIGDLGKLPPEAIQPAKRELESEGWIKTEGSWVWIRNHLRFDPLYAPGNPKQVAGLMKKVSALPRIQLAVEFVSYYKRLGFIPKTYRMGSGTSPMISAPITIAVTVTDTITDKDADSLSLAVDEIFDHWRKVMGKGDGAKLTAGRRKAILGRLGDGYKIHDLLRAIDGCKASEFHQGKNDTGTVYDDLTLICRSGEKVEFFRAKAPAEPATPARTAFDPDPEKRALQRIREAEARERAAS